MKLRCEDLSRVKADVRILTHRDSNEQVINQIDQNIYRLVQTIIKRRVNDVIDQIYNHVYEHFVDYKYTNRT